MAPHRREYKLIKAHPADLLKLLNAAGAEGWELVAVDRAEFKYHHIAFLKRAINGS